MNKIRFLNGADYFIYALDRNMHCSGLSGNYSVVLLEVDKPLDQTLLKEFIRNYFSKTPFYNLIFKNILGLIYYWKYSDRPIIPELNVYNTEDITPDTVVNTLLNHPLDRRNGKTIRFDTINCKNRYFLCITTDHVLMDAFGIQQFLYSFTSDIVINTNNNLSPGGTSLSFLSKLKLIRKSMKLLDSFALKARPYSFFTYRRPSSSQNSFRTRHFSFSLNESNKIIESAHLRCGYLNETNYFLLSVLKEVNNLYISSKLDPGSFVFPIIMHLGNNKHDSINQNNNITFLYYQVMKSEIEAGEEAILSSIKKQTVDQLKNDIPLGAYYGLQYLRVLPVNMYRNKMYQSLKGELANFFFSNIGGFEFKNNMLLGSKITNISHFPTVCISPGIVFTFSKYQNIINYTIVYIDNLFKDHEINNLVSGINKALLK